MNPVDDIVAIAAYAREQHCSYHKVTIQQVAATSAGIQGYVNSSLGREIRGELEALRVTRTQRPQEYLSLQPGIDKSNATPQQLHFMRINAQRAWHAQRILDRLLLDMRALLQSMERAMGPLDDIDDFDAAELDFDAAVLNYSKLVGPDGKDYQSTSLH